MLEQVISISAIREQAINARRWTDCHYPEGSKAREIWEAFFCVPDEDGLRPTFRVSQSREQEL